MEKLGIESCASPEISEEKVDDYLEVMFLNIKDSNKKLTRLMIHASMTIHKTFHDDDDDNE